MNPSDYWIDWFTQNCPKVPTSLKTKYSQALVNNDVADISVLVEFIELDHNYLKSIGIINELAVKSIKVRFICRSRRVLKIFHRNL